MSSSSIDRERLHFSFDLDEVLEEDLVALQEILKEYAILEAFLPNQSPSEGRTTNDFAYLLLAKATRSLDAAALLHKKNYVEDCLAVLRSVYEAYVTLAALVSRHTPSDTLFRLVSLKVGYSLGRFKPQVGLNGKINRSILVDVKTGLEYSAKVKLRSLVSYSKYRTDASLYDELYSYLSRIAHSDFRTLYTFVRLPTASPDSTRESLLAKFLIVFFFSLLLCELYHYEEFDPEDSTFLRETLAFARKVLLRAKPQYFQSDQRTIVRVLKSRAREIRLKPGRPSREED